MPLRIEPHEEPIPGYRLIERLGSGGFGEVWKCEAPGGLYKAIKFVQCETADDKRLSPSTNRTARRADQELKSLSRVKSVHHPYVISLDRFEIVQDDLVIVMELADRTLADRFKQCRSQGLPGVPRGIAQILARGGRSARSDEYRSISCSIWTSSRRTCSWSTITSRSRILGWSRTSTIRSS